MQKMSKMSQKICDCGEWVMMKIVMLIMILMENNIKQENGFLQSIATIKKKTNQNRVY